MTCFSVCSLQHFGFISAVNLSPPLRPAFYPLRSSSLKNNCLARSEILKFWFKHENKLLGQNGLGSSFASSKYFLRHFSWNLQPHPRRKKQSLATTSLPQVHNLTWYAPPGFIALSNSSCGWSVVTCDQTPFSGGLAVVAPAPGYSGSDLLSPPTGPIYYCCCETSFLTGSFWCIESLLNY